ncbi:hypothetical protein HMPREF1545_01965 [Oscillibacter sp. KLE 1728]|nr:hypothetical protein HMPREF1545_01965 [Oscillibacter sp. KLE 1728]
MHPPLEWNHNKPFQRRMQTIFLYFFISKFYFTLFYIDYRAVIFSSPAGSRAFLRSICLIKGENAKDSTCGRNSTGIFS